MRVLNGTASFIPFPPNLLINDAPTGIDDKLTGLASGFYNDLLFYSKIDAKVLPALEGGMCEWEDGETKCTGVAKMLYTGEVDFSITMIAPFFDSRINKVPHELAFPVNEQGKSFISPPISDVSEVNLHILSTFTNFNRTLVVWYTLSFVTLMLLINFSLCRRRWHSLLNWPIIYCMFLNISIHREFKAIRRRIVHICMILLSFVIFQMYQGSQQTALVVQEPENFLSTLEEVADSDYGILVFKGIGVASYMYNSKDRMHQKIIRKAEQLPFDKGDVLNEIASRLLDKKTVYLFNNMLLGWIIQSFLCIQTECDPPFEVRIAEPFASTAPFVGYSIHANESIKHRWRLINSWFMQNGLHDFYNSQGNMFSSFAPIISTYEGKFRRCVRQMNDAPEKYAEVPFVNFILFYTLCCAIVSMYCFSVLLLILELIFHMIRRRFRRWKKKRKLKTKVTPTK